MKTVAFDRIGKFFKGEWKLEDGHLKKDGNFLKNLPNQVLDYIINFCNFSSRFFFEEHKNRPPRMFLAIKESELNNSSIPETILTIEVQREDGRIARASISVGLTERHGLSATLSCPSRQKNVSRSVKMRYVDWDKPVN